MARTAPVPNIPAIPGMNPGVWVMGGGGGGGGGGGKGGGAGRGKQGAGGKGGGKNPNGGGKSSVPGCTKEGEPIDVATGSVLHERLDFSLQGIFALEWRVDRVEAIGDLELAYDGAGRVVRRARVSGGRREEIWLDWTSSDELASVADDRGNVTRYTYDAFGRRVMKRRPDGSVVFFVWDGNSIAAEVTVEPDGAERQVTFVFDEADPSWPVAQHDGDRWLDVLCTPIGTVTELVDERGDIAWSASYAAFGAIEALRAAKTTTSLRFPGQMANPESGLHYNRFRYYDPLAGRYLSPDPIGVDAGAREAACASPHYGYWLARIVDRGPTDDTRAAALRHPIYAAEYAYFVDRGPRDDTRAEAARDVAAALFYAEHVDRALTPPLVLALQRAGWGDADLATLELPIAP